MTKLIAKLTRTIRPARRPSALDVARSAVARLEDQAAQLEATADRLVAGLVILAGIGGRA